MAKRRRRDSCSSMNLGAHEENMQCSQVVVQHVLLLGEVESQKHSGPTVPRPSVEDRDKDSYQGKKRKNLPALPARERERRRGERVGPAKEPMMHLPFRRRTLTNECACTERFPWVMRLKHFAPAFAPILQKNENDTGPKDAGGSNHGGRNKEVLNLRHWVSESAQRGAPSRLSGH